MPEASGIALWSGCDANDEHTGRRSLIDKYIG
jgi:hypothetical protein